MDVIIIGCGISGALFAHFAAKSGKKVLIIEKNESAGGCISTIEPYDGFFAELGAHSMYNSYSVILEVIEQLGMQDKIKAVKKYPMLMFNGKFRSFLFSVSVFGMLGGLIKYRRVKKNDLSVEKYFKNVFGEKNYYNLFLPALSAIICQDAADNKAALLLKKRVKNKKYPRCFNFKRGMREFFNTLLSHPNITVKYNATIKQIKSENDGYAVVTDNLTGQEDFFVKSLVMAAGVSGLKEIFTMLNDVPMVEIVNELPLRTTFSYMCAAVADDIKVKKFSYAIAKDKAWRSAVSSDVNGITDHRAVTFHCKRQLNGEELADIRKLFKINSNFECNNIYELPQLRCGHESWLEKLDNELKKYDNIYVIGGFFGGLSLEDCAIRAKEQASIFVNKQIK